jgi:hypothetical protein
MPSTVDDRGGEIDQSEIHPCRKTCSGRDHRSQFGQSPSTQAAPPPKSDDRFRQEVMVLPLKAWFQKEDPQVLMWLAQAGTGAID